MNTDEVSRKIVETFKTRHFSLVENEHAYINILKMCEF